MGFKLSYLVGPRIKFRVLALSVQNAAKCLTLDPSTSFFPQVLIKTAEGKSGFRFQILYHARSVAKHCDWNQAPGCQSETPQIEAKTPQIEEKSSFRFNCLTLSRQAKTNKTVSSMNIGKYSCKSSSTILNLSKSLSAPLGGKHSYQTVFD